MTGIRRGFAARLGSLLVCVSTLIFLSSACGTEVERMLDVVESELHRIDELDQMVQNKAPFERAVGLELNDAHVSAVARVLRAVERVAPVSRLYRTASGPGMTHPVAEETLELLIDEFIPALERAKRAQVDALNGARMSVEEYRWAQREILAAWNVRVTPMNVAGLRRYVRWRMDETAGRQLYDSTVMGFGVELLDGMLPRSDSGVRIVDPFLLKRCAALRL